jgi:hypothetical protein
MDLDEIRDKAGWNSDDMLDVLVDFLHAMSLYSDATTYAESVAYQERLWHDK